MDSRFRVDVLAQTPNPQKLIYSCMHQCYAEDYVFNERSELTETRSGEIAVSRLLSGNRGHYNPLESPQISFNAGFFPHSVMQQLRTHRVSVSFSVQSFRYTGQRVLELGILGEQHSLESDFEPSTNLMKAVEDVFYIRPEGFYTDRQGKKYEVTKFQRQNDLYYCLLAAMRYRDSINTRGYSEEHARSLIPFDVRQHFTISGNVRSIFHILDLRSKKDAQLECQQFSELLVPHLRSWVPEIWDWYEMNRYQKARLSP